jgi:hypothetical protein
MRYSMIAGSDDIESEPAPEAQGESKKKGFGLHLPKGLPHKPTTMDPRKLQSLVSKSGAHPISRLSRLALG